MVGAKFPFFPKVQNEFCVPDMDKAVLNTLIVSLGCVREGVESLQVLNVGHDYL